MKKVFCLFIFLGFTIQLEEEKLRMQLEALQSQISAPTQFKGRLNELHLRIKSHVGWAPMARLNPALRYGTCKRLPVFVMELPW